jgi:hypothetical protein
VLVALPCEVHLALWVAGVQAGGDFGPLLIGEVFGAAVEQPAVLVERVVFVPAAMEGVLLDRAAALVGDLRAEPDHVKGVQDGDRVGQLVPDRLRATTERVECGLLDPAGEAVRLVIQPRLVGGVRPADNGV